jgi:uncharacterized protein YjbI with pentapeptide repeats
MRAHLPKRRTERRGLRLWPVGTVLVMAFAAAILVAAAVFYAGWDLLGARELKPERRIDSKTLFDLVKLSFGVVAGAGALVALVVAYRRQRVDEDGALREATRLHTERFTTAVSQLGDNSAAVRLGGVHALAGLADDAPTRDLRQTCIDVLCAYLRLPYIAEDELPTGDSGARHTYLALREVRHTVIRIIRDHLRLAPEQPNSWQGHDFDLTEVAFNGADFSNAVFSGGTVDFRGAVFSGGTLDFSQAAFSGSILTFSGAVFSGGMMDFRGAVFSDGWGNFSHAEFSGGRIAFSSAEFCGGRITFDYAKFSGSAVTFTGAEFSSGRLSVREAIFSNGTVDFRAAFSGSTVDFSSAEFSGGSVFFSGGDVYTIRTSTTTRIFGRTVFSAGTVDFRGATFSGGTVDFSDAEFSGATVDFSHALGAAPHGLVPASGASLPSGLSLPPAWYPVGS